MRRNLTGCLVLAVLSTSLLAFAADPPPPPPPPPPPADTTSNSGNSGDSAMRANDALFDASPKTRKSMLSFFIGIPYGGGYGACFGCGFPFGVGARFYIPIVPNGFIPTLNDSFGLEFGADFNIYTNFGFGFFVPAEARWGFHLIPKLEVYGKAGFALGAFIVTSAFSSGTYFHGYGIAVAGVVYHVTDTIALRAEVGYPAIKIGIGIAF